MIVLDNSDVISIIGIVSNIILVIWLTITIQNRINNSRVLKDFFMEEIKLIKNDFEIYISGLLEDKFLPKSINSDLNNFDLKFENLIRHLNPKYHTANDFFYQLSYELHTIIDNDVNYTSSFNNNTTFQFTSSTKTELEEYKTQHLVTFYNLIVEINDSKKV